MPCSAINCFVKTAILDLRNIYRTATHWDEETTTTDFISLFPNEGEIIGLEKKKNFTSNDIVPI